MCTKTSKCFSQLTWPFPLSFFFFLIDTLDWSVVSDSFFSVFSRNYEVRDHYFSTLSCNQNITSLYFIESALDILGHFFIICLLVVEYTHQNFLAFHRDEKILAIQEEILILPAKWSKELLEVAEKRNGLYFAYFIKKHSQSDWNMCKGDIRMECFEMWNKSEVRKNVPTSTSD